MTQVRRGTIDDIAELVRLREVMMASVRGEAGNGWQQSCADTLATALPDGSMVAVVVDDARGDGLAACGVGMLAQRLAGPHCLDGRVGYVQSMVTDDAHRRQGMARVVFAELMAWFREQGVTRVDLHASSMGEPLYRQLGFTENREPELRWRAG
jgi:GNAT superfamily N-acetyltransferase